MAPKIVLNPETALALAVVAASHTPLLLLDAKLAVVAASASFCQSFGLAHDIAGGEMFGLGAGEWETPQLRSLLGVTLSGRSKIEAYDFELKRADQPTRCLVLNAHLLDYAEGALPLLLLAIEDVTAARALARQMAELIRDREVLMQEVQHRVANSLQIIASVLMQSARKVQSEEARGHLRDAHNRVMSIAEVQRHLAASTKGEVALGPYFTQLCASLGASMIGDPGQLTIEVDADRSVVAADISVSLGLIVTELVINALKHAFPEHRSGRIVVGYHASGSGWTLAVGDDGVGMPAGHNAKPGLGTSIVHALAKQLGARITVADSAPGTHVEIVHAPVEAANDKAAAEAAQMVAV